MHRLIKYIQKRAKAINSILEKPKEEYSTRTFHKLRIEIKKVKAIFDLIDNSSKDFEFEKHFKPFKELFRQAGKVRELQLEEQILLKDQSFFTLEEYKNVLTDKILQEKKIYFSIININIKAQLEDKFQITASLLSQINKKEMNSYIEKKRSAIQKLLSTNPLKAQILHNIRKQIKIYNYNVKCISLKEVYKPESNLNKLAKMLGKWHDCQIFINHLNMIMDAGTLNPKEISQIKKLKSKISSKRERFLAKIGVIIPLTKF